MPTSTGCALEPHRAVGYNGMCVHPCRIHDQVALFANATFRKRVQSARDQHQHFQINMHPGIQLRPTFFFRSGPPLRTPHRGFFPLARSRPFLTPCLGTPPENAGVTSQFCSLLGSSRQRGGSYF